MNRECSAYVEMSPFYIETPSRLRTPGITVKVVYNGNEVWQKKIFSHFAHFAAEDIVIRKPFYETRMNRAIRKAGQLAQNLNRTSEKIATDK